jgi:hypothetical protein
MKLWKVFVVVAITLAIVVGGSFLFQQTAFNTMSDLAHGSSCSEEFVVFVEAAIETKDISFCEMENLETFLLYDDLFNGCRYNEFEFHNLGYVEYTRQGCGFLMAQIIDDLAICSTVSGDAQTGCLQYFQQRNT